MKEGKEYGRHRWVLEECYGEKTCDGYIDEVPGKITEYEYKNDSLCKMLIDTKWKFYG